MSTENVDETVPLLRGWDVLDGCDDCLLSSIRYFHAFSEGGALFVTTDDNVFGVGQNGEHNLLGVEGDHFLQETLDQPAKVERLCGRKVVAMSVGMWLGAAVTADGTLFRWGVTFEDSPISLPAPLKTDTKVISVACGAAFVVALTDNCQVYLWGSMNMCTEPTEARLLSADLTVVSISCGWWHVAMLTDKGELYTCGYGEDGQLGYTWLENDDVYKARNVDMRESCKQVVCGSISTLFVTNGGDIWACGENDIWQGALGVDTDDQCVVRPKKVRIECKVETIVATWGSPNIYAALSCDKLVYCWGESRYPTLLKNITSLEEACRNERTSLTVDQVKVPETRSFTAAALAIDCRELLEDTPPEKETTLAEQ